MSRLRFFLSILHEWCCRARTRRDIGQLDERECHDLGVSRSQMTFEAGKPFWRP
jgi:uncharacterized protein YjiS (DUF1127 family)